MFSIAYCTCSGLLVHFMFVDYHFDPSTFSSIFLYKELKKNNVISNKVCSLLLLVLLLLLACVFTLLAFVMFLLLCFTGI